MTMSLSSYLRAAAARPFRYGRHDCTTMCAGWVQARTGRDLLDGWAYGSLRTGRDLLAARGFVTQADAAAAVLPEIDPLRARVGDVAEVEGALGLVTGDTVALLRRPAGMVHRPLTDARRAFRVA
jgi:hypothetical protein